MIDFDLTISIGIKTVSAVYSYFIKKLSSFRKLKVLCIYSLCVFLIF